MMQLEWADEEDDGGVTWLELHALFRLHGGKIEEDGDEQNPSTTTLKRFLLKERPVHWQAHPKTITFFCFWKTLSINKSGLANLSYMYQRK